MRRGEVWAFAGGTAYGGKPRPAIIVQHDRFDGTDSITICPLTSTDAGIHLFRINIEPSAENGLREQSFAMADKMITVPRARLRRRIGTVSRADMTAISRAILLFLDLVG